jgi:hypothetical protein
MRGLTVLALCLVAACGGDDVEDTTFNGEGGTLEVPGCGYSVTTRFGAEVPKVAGTKIGADPTPRLVHLGFVGDPKTSIVAQWRTMDETTTAGSIRYGVGANLPEVQLTKTVKGIQFAYEGTGTEIYRVHQAHVCDLEAGTTYSYQVGSDDHWSSVYTFHTAPDVVAHPDAETVLGFVGDSRGGYDVWAQLATQLQQRTPDVLLFSGDAVTLGLIQPEWDEWLEAAQPLLATTPIVMANGNHEASVVNFFSQFAMPGDQENFGFDYGFAHIFVANDTPDGPFSILETETRAEIDADFTAHADARWKLLMHHRPMFSSGKNHGSDTALRAAWQPIVDKHHLDLVLNGHEHQFEMSKPVLGDAVDTNGTVYVVAGGAGADLYGFDDPGFWSDFMESTYTAAVIRLRQNTLSLDNFRPDGTALGNGYTKTKQ